MFKHLLIKEIRESVISFRFQLTFLICVILIPMSFYLGADTYKNRKEHIDNLERLYIEQHAGNVGYNIEAEGYRPPSPLSLFCMGLEDYFPDKIVTSREENYHYERAWGINNPISLLTGKIDFLFILCYIMPLLVFALTSNSISAEKENGTLRLILANNVPRWKLIAAKVTGPFILISICYIAGIILGLIILQLFPSGIDFNTSLIISLIVIFLLSLLFLFTLVNIGVFISVLAKNTFLSMIAGLVVYVAFSLIIPKLSPMLAQILYPVKSIQVHNTEVEITRNEIINRRENEKRNVMHDLKASYGLPQSLGDLKQSSAAQEIYDTKVIPVYDEKVMQIDQDYSTELQLTIERLENEYLGKIKKQHRIALSISRISPFSSFIILVSEMSSTGVGELENFREETKRFDDQVQSEIYDNVIIQRYYDSGGYFSRATYLKEVDENDVPYITEYYYMKTRDVLAANWLDVFLISLCAILFFALSFNRMNTYDVR